MCGIENGVWSCLITPPPFLPIILCQCCIYTIYNSSLTVYNIFSFHFCILRYGFILIKESLSNLFSLASSEIFLKCNFCVFFNLWEDFSLLLWWLPQGCRYLLKDVSFLFLGWFLSLSHTYFLCLIYCIQKHLMSLHDNNLCQSKLFPLHV